MTYYGTTFQFFGEASDTTPLPPSPLVRKLRGMVALRQGWSFGAGSPVTPQAIDAAEGPAGRGVLRLVRWRAGTTDVATLNLAPLGAYAATSPFGYDSLWYAAS